jgi:hypothetical protein
VADVLKKEIVFCAVLAQFLLSASDTEKTKAGPHVPEPKRGRAGSNKGNMRFNRNDHDRLLP